MQHQGYQPDGDRLRIEQGRAFARAFRTAWHEILGQDRKYRIVDYDDRDDLARQASDQISDDRRRETNLFLVRDNPAYPVGYDHCMFLETKAGTTGVRQDWFFADVIQPKYEIAQALHHRVWYENTPDLDTREDVFDLNAAELRRYVVHDENGIFDGGTAEDHGYVSFPIAVLVFAGFRAYDQQQLFAQWVRHTRVWAPYCPNSKDPIDPESWIANVNLADFGRLNEILCRGLEMKQELALEIERLTIEKALNEPLLASDDA